MNRRNFLLNFLLWILFFIFGYRVGNFHIKSGVLSEEWADTMTQVRCSDIGLTELDNGINNFNLLVSALKEKTTILVDGFYKLKPSETFYFTYDLSFKGITDNAGFSLENDVVLFSTTTNHLHVSIENISLTNPYTTHVAKGIHLKDSVVSMRYVNFINCSFSGRLQLFDFTANVTQNPYTYQYGIKEFVFKYNKINNLTSTFITLHNCPHDLIDFSHNEVQNWDYLLLNSGVSASPFSDDITKLKKTVRISHNRAVCDDDFWHNIESTNMYYALALVESQELIYEFNHVEGMKTTKSLGMYDVYASSNRVYYRNNTYKNNVNFDTIATSNRTLMKAKSGSGFKNYENNKYIVEDSFIEKFAYNPIDMRYHLYDINAYTEEWNIIGNYIDVPRLRFQTSSTELDRITFSNNTLKAKRCEGYLITSNKEGCSAKIENNIFRIDEDTVEYSLVRSFSDAYYDNVIIKGNDIKGFMRYGLYDVKAHKVLIDSNTFEINSTDDSSVTFIYKSKFDELLLKNTSIKTRAQARLTSSTEYVGDIDINSDIITKQYINTSNTINFNYLKDYLKPLAVEQTYLFELSIKSKLDQYKAYTTFSAYSSGGINYVKFTDTTNTEYVCPVAELTSGVNGTGHAKNLKFNTSIPFRMQFINTPENTNITIIDTNLAINAVISFSVYKINR